MLNGFTTPKDVRPPPELSLLTSTFQHLFPPLSAQTTSVSSIRRVLLCNRTTITGSKADENDIDVIDIRHYSVSTKSVGVSRTIRKTDAKTSTLPNLGKFEDVADFVLSGDGYDSASEIDEDDKVEVRTSSIVKETTGTQQRAVKLTEIGPRMRLELVKIEEGMCDGQVLYHRYVQKTKVYLLR